jgi:hypothetical protein
MKRDSDRTDSETTPASAQPQESSGAAQGGNGTLPDGHNGDRTDFETHWHGPVPPGLGDPEALSRALFDAREAAGESVHREAGGLYLTEEDLSDLHTTRDFIRLLRSKHVDVRRIKASVVYEYELESLQIEMVKLQHWIQEEGRRVAILFEGRDAAGKGGTIRRFIEHLNPRAMRVVALPAPTREERGPMVFSALHEAAAQCRGNRVLRPQLVQPRGGRAGERVLHARTVRPLSATGAGIRAHAGRRRRDAREVLVFDFPRGADRPVRLAPRQPAQTMEAEPAGCEGAGTVGRLHEVQRNHVQPHAHQLQPVDHHSGEQQAFRPAGKHALRPVAVRVRRERETPASA